MGKTVHGWVIASNDRHELSVDMSDIYGDVHPLFATKQDAERAIQHSFPGNEHRFKARKSGRFVP
jgi:hypothetical protein